MKNLESLSGWIALPLALLLILGGCIIVIGALGLLRLPNFYQRMHGPAILTTLGSGCLLISSMVIFTVLQQRLVFHELIITLFIMMTAPVSAMLLMRAAVYRDRRAGKQLDGHSESAMDEAEFPGQS